MSRVRVTLSSDVAQADDDIHLHLLGRGFEETVTTIGARVREAIEDARAAFARGESADLYAWVPHIRFASNR